MTEPRGVIVVKCGGAAGVDMAAVCADVAALVSAGERVVLVHGGSAAVAELAGRLGVPLREIVSPSGVTARHTDEATLDVVNLALLGRVKTELLTELGRRGVRAVGLSGLDAGLIRARRKKAVRAVVDGRRILVRDDRSGKIVSLDAGLLTGLLDAGLVPVVSPPAVAEDGHPVNVNADRVAAWTAAELKARSLVLLTAAPGLLADSSDERSVLRESRLPPGGGVPAHVTGGMATKLIAAGEALAAGVEHVVIADGRAERPVAAALGGAGTRLRAAGPAPSTRSPAPSAASDTAWCTPPAPARHVTARNPQDPSPPER
ncbi:[LysW]-aminoadipate kinase [Actinomadura viridis]|uniref:[LysW]-aminoadipate kinase n=1 Tax=Actinomadura viridis TaxID=58110 RepID=UPI0036861872